MRDKNYLKFTKTMASYPTILRTQYVYALLADNDWNAAQKYKDKFAKISKTYPNAGEIEGERELMEYAEQLQK